MECVCLIMIMVQGICMQFNKLMTVMVVSSALALSGCSAMGTAIKKRNLEVKTQMSETIWLEPSNNKTVYLQIKIPPIRI